MIIIFGAHGAGKGTQARLISEYYNIPKITTGEIFRDMLDNPNKVSYIDSSLVEKVKHHLDRREYVKKAKPLIDYYKDLGVLVDIDGEMDVYDIFEQIKVL